MGVEGVWDVKGQERGPEGEEGGAKSGGEEAAWCSQLSVLGQGPLSLRSLSFPPEQWADASLLGGHCEGCSQCLLCAYAVAPAVLEAGWPHNSLLEGSGPLGCCPFGSPGLSSLRVGALRLRGQSLRSRCLVWPWIIRATVM